MVHTGRCHCGAIRLTFATERPLAPRACQCGFCRRHGARTVTDPQGSATITLGPDTIRYRFGTGTSDYLLCRRCGVYAGAVARIDSAWFATLNLNAFDDPRLHLVAEPVSYEGEGAEAKAARRRRNWTPARVDG
ncbi:MAG TPA: hypothetical protein VF704_01430 [Allosphingosinicella sp.]|jgi:hypothetical protein